MQQGKADALSRHPYMELQLGEAAFENLKQILLGHDRLQLMAFHAIDTPEDSSILDSIREHLGTDKFAQGILNHIIPDRASCSQSQNPRQDYNQLVGMMGYLFDKIYCMCPTVLLDSKFCNNVMTHQWLDISASTRHSR